MRPVVMALFVAMSFIPYAMVQVSAQGAVPGCSCKGCGCKGSPGWRSPESYCVSSAKLASVCGSPAGARCIHEAAAQVCAAKALDAASQTETETP